MYQRLKSIHRDQTGQGMAEYGLIIALVAVAAMAAFGVLGKKIYDKVTDVNDEFDK